MKKLTHPQAALLYDLVDAPREYFVPNVAVLRALTARGLIRCHFIGQRWWRASITKAGRTAIAALEARP